MCAVLIGNEFVSKMSTDLGLDVLASDPSGWRTCLSWNPPSSSQVVVAPCSFNSDLESAVSTLENNLIDAFSTLIAEVFVTVNPDNLASLVSLPDIGPDFFSTLKDHLKSFDAASGLHKWKLNVWTSPYRWAMFHPMRSFIRDVAHNGGMQLHRSEY